jgi:aspartate/methionine/tyrosine aminotransferase
MFHSSGGYTETTGSLECRKQLADFESEIFGMNITSENVIVGQNSTQLTFDILKVLLNPADKVLLFDPTYANYVGQIEWTGGEIVYLSMLDPIGWTYAGGNIIQKFQEIYERYKPKLVLFPSPDNPTSQIIPQRLIDRMLDQNMYVIIDYAYKTQYFGDMPTYFSYSPNDYPMLITINSNSKWCRGLGRRLGWLIADKKIIECMERVQQCSILCPDTLHQFALTEYLKDALRDGTLKKYIEDTRKKYERVANITVKHIEKYVGFPYLRPQGGLYVVMNIGIDSDKFVMNVFKNTGVLFIPGSGFGKSLRYGVRISYGPLVDDVDKIAEGLERVSKWLNMQTEC